MKVNRGYRVRWEYKGEVVKWEKKEAKAKKLNRDEKRRLGILREIHEVSLSHMKSIKRE
jgi:hypothetical protein